MKRLHHHTSFGFRHSSLHAVSEPHAIFYLKQRTSFWIATLSLMTFLVGNMMGQHGWYAFWASVLGQEDLSAIAYVGTASPIDKVVDYGCWAQYGGDYKLHTFRQAPENCLRSMPAYTSSPVHDDAFSMQYMSSYAHTTEGTGTHAGVDVRVPVGTPIRAVMSGKVYRVGDQPGGFGVFVVLIHPNVPDPDNPSGALTTLYSEYAHLSTQLVREGDIVHKGDVIALSGNTGNTTGPHLHFSVSREDVPYVPYYPSSMADGYAYTVSPLLYVQRNFAPVIEKSVVVVDSRVEDTVESIVSRLQARRDERLQERLVARARRQTTVALQTGVIPTQQPVQSAAPEPAPVKAVAAEQTVQQDVGGSEVATVDIRHDGMYSGRGWEKVRVTLLDANGNTVTAPKLRSSVAIRVEFGSAELRPDVLTAADFVQGEATVHILPRGRRTLVLKALPFNILSKPMQFNR